MKKITLKDIAKEAGVSVATVSYVLNRVPNQTIPADTQKSILDIANRLNYVPNLAARSLVKRSSGLIGIILMDNGPQYWKDFNHARFIRRFEQLCAHKGYHVVIASLDAFEPNLRIILERELDGVLIVDVSSDVFYRISRQFPFGVPIVMVDSNIQDELFHRVIPDFMQAISLAKARLGADYQFLITDSYNDSNVMNEIAYASGLNLSRFHVMNSEWELEQFLRQHEGRKGIVINELIASICLRYASSADLAVICTNECRELLPPEVCTIGFERQKADQAWELLSLHMEAFDFTEQDKTVRMAPDTK